MIENQKEKTIAIPEGIDSEFLTKDFNNPEMAALLSALAKSMPEWYQSTIKRDGWEVSQKGTPLSRLFFINEQDE